MKSLPLTTFDKCVKCIGMRMIKDLQDLRGDSLNKSPVFSHKYPENILFVLQESNCMTSSTVRGSVTNSLKYKFKHKFELQIYN
jgi:hypothetical protein